MLPRYLLVHLDRGPHLLGCDEWTDLLPFHPSLVRIKVLYSSHNPGQSLEPRCIGGSSLYEVKRQAGDAGVVYRTEKELRAPFASMSADDGVSDLHHLLPVPKRAITQVWPSIPWMKRSQNLAGHLVDTVVELLAPAAAKQPALALDRAWVMGSLAYIPETADAQDVDIAFAASRKEAIALRHWVACVRTEHPECQPHDEPFMFPFKLEKSGVTVDLFPCIDTSRFEPSQCPLVHASKWQVQGSLRRRRTAVVDIGLSCYAFPVLKVEGEPTYMIIGSNAFRGAFLPGDVLDCSVQRVLVRGPEGDISVDFIPDPWENLGRWRELIRLDRDREWLRYQWDELA